MDSRARYEFLAAGSFEPTMRLVVWRDGRHQELTLTVPQRHFGANLVDHPAAAPAHIVR